MEQILLGKTAIITGSSSGIGRALAIGFAKLGANLVISGRNQERLNQVQADIESIGAKVLVCQCDVTDYGQVKIMVDRAIEQFSKVDILINNAGYSRVQKIHRLRVEQFQQVIKTNVMGVYNCTHAVVPHMKENKSGTILNTGSQAVNFALPGWSVYAMTKSALTSFTTCLGVELKSDKINVNTIMPNMVDTPLLRSGMSDDEVKTLNPILPEELIPYYAFFCVKSGSKVTGLNADLDVVGRVLALKSALPEAQQPEASWKVLKELAAEQLSGEDFKKAKAARKLINFLLEWK